MRRFSLSVLLLSALGLAAANPALAKDDATQGLRYPSLTPDNASVVFAYRGDIWIARVDGKGIARRLTIHEAQETLPRVSPDGQHVAFSSRRNGGYDLFVVGIEGGLPRQVTFHGGPEILCDWSPDGKRLLFMSARGPSLTGMDLYEVPVEGGTPRPVTRDGGRDGAYHPDGKRVVYARGFVDIYWDGYEGGADFDLYTVAEPGALPVRLSDAEGNQRYPAYAADGETIYFIAESKGVANVFARPATGGERRQVTAFAEDIWRPDLAWDGKTLVFEQGGHICTTDLKAEKPEAKKLPVVVKSDVRHSGIEERVITTGPEQVDVSDDGTRLVFAVHGDLWSMPAGGGQATRLTESKATEQWPRFSPDGRRVAYQSDASGNSDLFVMDLASKQSRRVTKHQADDFFHAWSPDGTQLVFSSERSGNRDIWLLDIESGATKQLTRHPAPDDDPVFSPDGRSIAFDSGREGTQAIYVMALDGGAPRRVTTGTTFYQVPTFSPDGNMIAFEAFNQATGRSGGLFVVSVAGGPQIQLTRSGATATWSPKGDWIYYTAERNGKTEIYRHPAPTSIDMSEKVPFQGRIEVSLRDELADLFDEIWEELYLGFYDPKMHGVDWKAMRKKYRELAIDAEIKSEFHNVIRQMLAELGASHLGISGGDDTDSIVEPTLVETGQLGLDFDPAPAKGGGLRVASVVPGGPADQAGLRVGDVVEALAGKKLEAKTNLDPLLAGQVGKEVKLRFRPVTADGLGDARTVSMTPGNWRQMWNLTYGNWVKTNARRVKEETKGRIGYVHLLQMNGENLQKFQRAVAGWNRNPKIKGMVLDVRNNGGGNIHQQLLQILSARPFMQFKPRQRGDTPQQHDRKPKITQPALYWGKPVVVLINERSFSDAEVFPHAFRTAGLGKLVGVRTAGGVIGTNDITLSDGSRLRIPRVGYFGMDGKTLEGDGVEPDILVQLTPEDRREGRDPQLAAAIETILAEVKAAKEQEKEQEKEKEKEKEAPKPETTTPDAPPPSPAPTTEGSDEEPLLDARVGEWVRYRVRYGGSETLLRLEVVARDGQTVRFAKTILEGGAFEPPFPEALPAAPLAEALASLGRTWDPAPGTATREGRTLKVWTAMLEWEGTPVRLAFTNVVPALGLLEARVDGEIVLEAVDWSGRETPETPETATAPEAPAKVPFPNPAHDAEEGEWVRYRQVVPAGEVELTLEVVAIEGEELAIAATIRMEGRTMDGPVARRPRSEAYNFPGGASAVWEEDAAVVEVDGRQVTCRIAKLALPDGTEVRVWISPDVPVTGLVREERGGEVVRELVAFGRDGAPVG